MKDNDYVAMARAISKMCESRDCCVGCPLEKVEGICLSYFTPDGWDFEKVEDKA